MQKKNINQLFRSARSMIPRTIGFVVSYFIILKIITWIPYLNLQTIDWQWTMFIVYLLFVCWFNPKYHLLIMFTFALLIFGKISELTGVLIYISLIVIFIKLLFDRKAAVG